ncbi:flagellar biosynthetic protein FliO [Legionella bononiensis]|uniref:Flagellar protein n=1 Tax=Legionella bononiensis TaxID=2793102 RepID=A0ABS1WCU1_9GAMM|nr:flagellar biosynthetic protein FliO [Legionella bononiensis]MBL7479038.1 flagellar biosynthetic protein FliO [Legionella bononiensis]MBL7527171.1 flagellar biosynthetic protein FliO [Legionella bononiensis]MBL7562140.1 flagellar biosynthetic protein FliO [Legionella bononiensis]
MIKKAYSLLIVTFCLISSMAYAVPTETSNMISQSELTRVISGLLLVLLVIVLLSWMVRRLQGANFSSSKGFQSVASLTLGPKERVILLKVGVRYLLMGVGSSSVTLLYDFGEQLPSGFDPDNKTTFADLLKSAVGKSK